ncbi:MAG: hypothetical protein LIP01_11845, partial [Tannerellaceae bacterium]|nr:hypothetical protein [Tannerellaceae bacterium]
AGITSKVFYQWFGDLEGFLEVYTKTLDYWMNDILEYRSPKKTEIKEYYKTAIIQLAKSLMENKSIQQLLIWEIADKNSVTRRSKKLRELNVAAKMESIEQWFAHTDVDVRARTALLVGGIYYTIITRELSEFCGINFGDEKSNERLFRAIEHIVDKLFEPVSTDHKSIQEIVSALKQKGIDPTVIAECTGLSIKEIKDINS